MLYIYSLKLLKLVLLELGLEYCLHEILEVRHAYSYDYTTIFEGNQLLEWHKCSILTLIL